MRAMKHQLMTDFRHFRHFLILYWALAALQLVLLPGSNGQVSLVYAIQFVIFLTQLQITVFITARCIQSDPFNSSSAFWMTRPIARRELLVSKTIWLVLAFILPSLISHCSGWLLLDASWKQLAQCALQVLLFAVPVVFMAATLAAITPDLGSFVGTGVAHLVVLVVWGMILSFAATHSLRPGAPSSPAELNMTKSLLAGMFLCSGLCLSAWVLQLFRPRRWVTFSMVALAVLAFPTTLWLYRPRRAPIQLTTEHPRLSMSFIDPGSDASPGPNEQVMWSRFRVAPIRPGQVAAITSLDVKMTCRDPQTGKTVSARGALQPVFDHPLNRWYSRETWASAVKRLFPGNTLWSSADMLQHVEQLPVSLDLPKNCRKQRGRLEGEAQFTLYDVVHRTQIGLGDRKVTVEPGRILRLGDATWNNGVVTLPVSETVIINHFFAPERLPTSPFTPPNVSFRSFVIYHPASGEAHVLPDPFQKRYRGDHGVTIKTQSAGLTFPLPALRTTLTGAAPEDWLRRAELHIVEARFRELCITSFSIDNYQLDAQRPPSPTPSPSPAVPAPETTGGRALQDQIRELLADLPDRGQEGIPAIRDRLIALGPEAVPAFLKQLPIENTYSYSIVRAVLARTARVEHIPDLLDATRRGVDLAWLFRRLKCKKAVEGTILEQLRNHGSYVSIDALQIAIEAQAPKSYSDIAWHFIHMPSGHAIVFPALRECPGFPLEEMLLQAWHRACINEARISDLADIVAPLGIPSAFDEAIGLLDTRLTGKRQEQILENLRSITRYKGPDEAFPQYLTVNRGKFEFDQEAHQFCVPN